MRLPSVAVSTEQLANVRRVLTVQLGVIIWLVLPSRAHHEAVKAASSMRNDVRRAESSVAVNLI
jgi:hypothetical protein